MEHLALAPSWQLLFCLPVGMLASMAIRTVALFSVLLLESNASLAKGGKRWDEEQGSTLSALGMVSFQICSQPQPFP